MSVNKCAKMPTLSSVLSYEQMIRITSEFSRLGDRCYLENAGATLYPQCLLRQINNDLMSNVYMNPHTDKYTKDCIEQARCLVLRHFNTDPSNYSVIFTSGTTQSLKLVVESFQFAQDEHGVMSCGSFVYLRDNHTSVLGLREIADAKGADIIHVSHEDFMESLNINQTVPNGQAYFKNEGNTLLVYPAQSNFNGYKYPLHQMESIQKGILNNIIKKNLCKITCNWYVLLDAASYVPTSTLDLSKTQPDFVALSFYKIFGYPTGLGALLVKNSSAPLLSQKRYFGGGTVDVVLSSEDYHVKRQNFVERFEDGTHPFLSIVALKHCFEMLNTLIPKTVSSNVMDTITKHTFSLARDLYIQLNKVQHRNGKKVAVLYMDSDFTDIEKQGATVTFNILRDDGSYIGYAEFQHMADLFNINVRTGCFCNSGSCQRHLKATNKEMKDMYKAGHKCGDDIDLLNGKPTGAIRASFGYYNTFDDVDKFMKMIHRCYIKSKFKRPTRRMKSATHEVSIKPIINTIFNEESYLVKGNDDYFKNYTEIIPDTVLQTNSSEIVLSEIAIYPIKSCGAMKINSWNIGTKGFEYDREWMIININGVCLTQKQQPRMCLVKPVVDLKEKQLTLNFPGKLPISLPLDTIPGYSIQEASFCQTKVCTDIVKGIDCGDKVADWISEALEISYLRLVRQLSTDLRTQKKKDEGEKKPLSLSNQAQYLLINKATVRWLRKQIQDHQFTENVNCLTDRFRGNIIIEMNDELMERDWRRLIIGKHEFKVEGQCNRCQMVCIDQHTGMKSVEPLRTIAEQFAGKLRFGIYLSYVGTVDGSKDRLLHKNSPIQPITADLNICRFKDWVYTHLLYRCSCLEIESEISEHYLYKKIQSRD